MVRTHEERGVYGEIPRGEKILRGPTRREGVVRSHEKRRFRDRLSHISPSLLVYEDEAAVVNRGSL